jgi:inward rectifier potassium channel
MPEEKRLDPAESTVSGQESFDPGLTQKYSGTIRRFINKDGSFNVHRQLSGLKNLHVYQYLINISWKKFFALVVLSYFGVNALFALIYMLFGVENLQGAEGKTVLGGFLDAFYFSVHTFTTVGFGSISPKGTAVNLVASVEALVGWMSLALATGLFFARFSRPTARIIFSKQALIAPYQSGTSLQFRIANLRDNVIVDLEGKLLLMTVENNSGQLQRRYYELKLERPGIHFFPLAWTVVHPIDETSPFFGKKDSDLASLQAEIMILIKGFDDTFSQVVHTRYSYRYDEILWGARFVPIFYIDKQGDVILELDRISETVTAELA